MANMYNPMSPGVGGQGLWQPLPTYNISGSTITASSGNFQITPVLNGLQGMTDAFAQLRKAFDAVGLSKKDDQTDEFHALLVMREEGDLEGELDATVFHPSSCPLVVNSHENGATHMCPTGNDIRANGIPDDFYDLASGVYFVAPWIAKVGGPHTPEYDAGWHVMTVEDLIAENEP